MKTNDKGITLVTLIITIILMLILLQGAIEFGGDLIDKANLEDIKTTMLLIQGKARTIADKVSFEDETVSYIGEKITDISVYPYLNNSEGNYYKLNSENLNSMGITNVEITEEEFYIVDYESCEIYYSLGYNERYSLTEISEE